MWEYLGFFRSIWNRAKDLEIFFSPHVGLCGYSFELEHGNTYSCKETDILYINVQRNTLRLEPDIIHWHFQDQLFWTSPSAFLLLACLLYWLCPTGSGHWLLQTQIFLQLGYRIFWLIMVIFIRIFMDHEYYQADKSFSPNYTHPILKD